MKIKTKDLILISLFTALTAASAFIKIPLYPVPITLQFLFISLSAIFLGANKGAISQLIYVVIGLLGVPIFTNGGGLSYVFSPSFGFLIGFIFSSFVIGKIIEFYKSYNFKILIVANLTGILIIYLIGVPYFYYIFKYIMGKNITFYYALKASFLVFLPGDLLKCLLSSFIGNRIGSNISIYTS